MKEKCKIILPLIILVFILSLTPLYALPNNCPRYGCARIWEPCSWDTEHAIYEVLLISCVRDS